MIENTVIGVFLFIARNASEVWAARKLQRKIVDKVHKRVIPTHYIIQKLLTAIQE
jgi:hypothetical protein